MHYLVKLAQLVCDTGIIGCVSWRGLAQHMKVKVGLPKVKLVWLTSKPQLLSRHSSIHPSSTCSPIHSPSYPVIQPSTNPSIHHSSTHLSTHPSTHLPIHLHIHPSMQPSIRKSGGANWWMSTGCFRVTSGSLLLGWLMKWSPEDRDIGRV